mmetsp:Transcript_8444/g.30473  ORF Transcript_8444/g.30473 Transcript_8444/m.30473 type:complete len:213 (-) Transcript_8444:1193-1831(-)
MIMHTTHGDARAPGHSRLGAAGRCRFHAVEEGLHGGPLLVDLRPNGEVPEQAPARVPLLLLDPAGRPNRREPGRELQRVATLHDPVHGLDAWRGAPLGPLGRGERRWRRGPVLAIVLVLVRHAQAAPELHVRQVGRRGHEARGEGLPRSRARGRGQVVSLLSPPRRRGRLLEVTQPLRRLPRPRHPFFFFFFFWKNSKFPKIERPLDGAKVE